MGKILVTGGAGFIGSHVAQKLLEKGYEVVIVDDFNDYYDVRLKRDRVETLLKNVDVRELNICDLEQLGEIFAKEKFDKICHLAARAGVRASINDPLLYQRVNVGGTLGLLELARKFGVPHFVMASSSSVYGNSRKIPFSEKQHDLLPISPYAATKRSAELLAYTFHHLYKLKVTCLRYFTVYGPFGRPDMAAYLFAEAISDGQPIKLFNHGKMKRDFTYIDDIVDGTVAAIERPFDFEIINLGNHKPVKLEYFVNVLAQAMGMEVKKDYLPMQAGDVEETYADIVKARRLLDFAPKISIEDGLQRFTEWYMAYRP